MTDFWALQPLKTISNPGETFNLSSPNSAINMLSIVFFTIILVMKKLMPHKNIGSLFAYAMIFFIILTSFLSDDFMKPPNNPRMGISGADGLTGVTPADGDSNPYDFSRTKPEADVLTIS